MAEPEGFLARWSRRKQEARRRPELPAEPVAPPPAGLAPGEPPPELPPIESLTAESDFAPFMRPDVPEALRQAALQKLWRSDPVYANLDGLLEYGEDYAAIYNAGGEVATVYRVLEGMPGPSVAATEEPAPEAAAASEEASPEAAPAAAAAPAASEASDGRPTSDGVI